MSNGRTALARAEPQGVDLSRFDPNEYNVLGGMLVHDTGASHVRQRVIEVRLDPDPENGDCYKAPGGKKLAPSKIGLLKIAWAVDLVIAPHPFTGRIRSAARERCLEMAKAIGRIPCEPDCPCRSDVAYRCTAAIRTPSGDWRAVSATYEWESVGQRLKMRDEAQFDRAFSERHGLAETKALLRAARAGCGINHAYPPDVFGRPFILVRTDLVIDGDDPEIRKLLVERGLASGADIFRGNAGQPTATVQPIPQEPDWSHLVPEPIPPEPDEDEPPEDEEPQEPPTDADGQAEFPMADPFAEDVVKCDDCGEPVEPEALVYCKTDAGCDEFGGATFCVKCGKKARAAQSKAPAKSTKGTRRSKAATT